ncbi:hypothetical protein OIU79_028921, partial [Salix purpurea]
MHSQLAYITTGRPTSGYS